VSDTSAGHPLGVAAEDSLTLAVHATIYCGYAGQLHTKIY